VPEEIHIKAVSTSTLRHKPSPRPR